MRTQTSFSILFWLYQKRIDLNNEASLYVRLTLNGKRINISLKQKINVDLWDSKRQRAKGNKGSTKIINSYLDEVKADLFQLFRELRRSEKVVTPELVKTHYLGENSQSRTVRNVFDFHNETFASKLAPKTLCHYRTNQKYILGYIEKLYGKKDYYLKDLDYQFILGFESFLRSFQSEHYRGKIGNNAVMKHIQRFRKQIKLAIELEWLGKDPFEKFKPKMEKREREFLNQDELERIKGLNSNIERLSIVKDLFLFSCYTGISYADIVNLKLEHIIVGIDGKKWISSKRFKNGNPYKIPLLDVPIQLINKYLGHEKTKYNSNLLPKISNQKLNSYLKEVADLCSISKNLTFHMARHTFATTVTLSNGVPIETVSKMLGHTKLATTQIYARVLDRKISDDMNALSLKLNSK